MRPASLALGIQLSQLTLEASCLNCRGWVFWEVSMVEVASGRRMRLGMVFLSYISLKYRNIELAGVNIKIKNIL